MSKFVERRNLSTNKPVIRSMSAYIERGQGMIFAAGTPIGGLVGFVTAFMTYVYFRDAFRPANQVQAAPPSDFMTAAKLGSLIPVWFGGPVLNLTSVDWNHEIGYYVALSVVYGVLVSPLLGKVAMRVMTGDGR